MSYIDSIDIPWLGLSVGSLFSLPILCYYDLLPDFVRRMVIYGKSADIKRTHEQTSDQVGYQADDDDGGRKSLLELPKSYFFHFYSLALIFYLFLASMVINIYFDINLFNDRLQISSTTIKTILDKFTNFELINYQRVATVSPESVCIGLTLLIIQVTRRLCECKMVSVYSNGKMNIIHYMSGHFFYIGVGLSMLAEAPGFAGTVPAARFRADKSEFITASHLIGIALFAWASYVQFDSHRILANLRKDKSGRVVTTKHTIPAGKWFDLVSCPHYMAEILIYLALTIVLSGKSFTWWLVFLFVVTNQIAMGKFNHSWYLRNFKNYPRYRRAIIPYLV